MFLQNCQPATSTSSRLLVITSPPFLYAREHNYSCGNSALSHSFPPSLFFLAVFSPFLGITLNGYLWKEGGRLLLVQRLPRTLSSKKPCEHALDPSQSDHLAVCFWRKSDPGMQVKPESADRLTALLGQPVLADWKNAEGKITCLAPDGINIFLYIHTSMFIIFCLKLFAYLIYSLMLSGQYLKHFEICANAIRLQGLEAK